MKVFIIIYFSQLFLVGRNADKQVLIRFGIPAVIAAFAGSWVLLNITDLEPLFKYEMFGRSFTVETVKFIIAILLIIFALMDLNSSKDHFYFFLKK